MHPSLDAIFQRRAIRVFDPVDIPPSLRDQLLHAARLARPRFNSQPYRLVWVASPESRRTVAQLSLSQPTAVTASAFVVAVADLGCWRSTPLSQLAGMRACGFSPEKISEYDRKSKFAKCFYIQGWCNLFGAITWLVLGADNLLKIIGMPPVTRQGLFQWATKNTSLACENLMIVTESLGLNICPLEGFEARRPFHLLHLSRGDQEIVMVLAIGKKSPLHIDQAQWRRPLESTVTIL